MLKVLFATPEAHPLVKTGGLGDVAGSLPLALQRLGCDIRLVVPAYRQVSGHAGSIVKTHPLSIPGSSEPVRLLEGLLSTGSLKFYLVDAPRLFDRPGGPYTRLDGGDWPDNAERFALFSRAVVEVARGRAGVSWQPDVVHCNDWQTGLVPALLAREPSRPATVFTIHNLAYQGLCGWHTFAGLHLPRALWAPEAMEFYGQFSFIKGGIVFADILTTVSPTYAGQIQTSGFGCGLDGLLRHRASDLVGILNGVDYAVWDPRHDAFIAARYDPCTLGNKASNKHDLQQRLGLPPDNSAFLLGIVTRLVEQKGIDLVVDAVPRLWQENLQLALLGNGDPHLQTAVERLARQRPDHVAAVIEFSDEMAHRIIAGADAFVMPSRFEPGGLTQMYSLRYGTIPIVRRTGGLADTVIDATPENLRQRLATGIVFSHPTVESLLTALRRGLKLYLSADTWRELQLTGMAQDYGWLKSAEAYAEIYGRARRRLGGSPVGS